MVDFSCNTLVNYNGTWWTVENGKITLEEALTEEARAKNYALFERIKNKKKKE